MLLEYYEHDYVNCQVRCTFGRVLNVIFLFLPLFKKFESCRQIPGAGESVTFAFFLTKPS